MALAKPASLSRRKLDETENLSDEQNDPRNESQLQEGVDNEVNEDNEDYVDEPEEEEEGPPRFIRPERFNRLYAKPSGNMIRMKCPAEGRPMPNITWTKDNQPIVRSMGEVSLKKWGIVLEELVPKDSGNYTCTVCNVKGCINFTTILRVKGKCFVFVEKCFRISSVSDSVAHNLSYEKNKKILQYLQTDIPFRLTY